MTRSQEFLSRVRETVDQFYGDSPLSQETTMSHWTLAMDVWKHLMQTAEPLSRLEDEIDMDVSGWLLDLPFTLATQGMVDEAVTLGARYAEIAEAETFLGDRAVILAEAGRHEEALAQAQENLTRFANDPWVTIKCGDVYEQIGKLHQAEHRFRQGLHLAGDDAYTRAGAVERLIPFLDKTGRETEADALIEAETTREFERKERVAKAWPGGQRYPTPKFQSNPPVDPYEEPEDPDSFPLPYIREPPK